MSGVKISALGCYVPPGILSNHDLEKMVETSDEWILQRVGISERHIAAADVATSDMAVKPLARRWPSVASKAANSMRSWYAPSRPT